MSKITAICQECNTQFEYDLKPGFPRKYCFECSEAKKAAFSGGVPKPKVYNAPSQPTQGSFTATEQPKTGIKEPTGEYQSLVYTKTLGANSYEVGKSGDRFKLYFETVEELQAKIKELKDAGLMVEDLDLRGMTDTRII